MKIMSVLIGLVVALSANSVSAQEDALPSELFDMEAVVKEADAATQPSKVTLDRDARAKVMAKKRYAIEQIHFDPNSEDRIAYRFGDNRVLEGADFYSALGREDLAEAYSKKKGQKDFGVAMMVGGAVGLTVAGTMVVVNSAVNMFSGFIPGGGGVTAGSNAPLFLAGASTAALVTGLVVTPGEVHPVSREEADRLVQKHNNGLKNRLGIPDSYKRPGTQERSKLDVNVGVGSDGENGQMLLRVDF